MWSQRLSLYCVQQACVADVSDMAAALAAVGRQASVNPTRAHHSQMCHLHDCLGGKSNALKVRQLDKRDKTVEL